MSLIRGVKKMCDILDEYAKDYVEEYVEGRLREKEIRNAKELFANNLSVAMVKKYQNFYPKKN